MIITRQMSKAARAMVGWNAVELSERANVSHDTIRSFESGRTATLNAKNQEAVNSAFKAAGVQFLESGDTSTGPGVALQEEKND